MRIIIILSILFCSISASPDSGAPGSQNGPWLKHSEEGRKNWAEFPGPFKIAMGALWCFLLFSGGKNTAGNVKFPQPISRAVAKDHALTDQTIVNEAFEQMSVTDLGNFGLSLYSRDDVRTALSGIDPTQIEFCPVSPTISAQPPSKSPEQ